MNTKFRATPQCEACGKEEATSFSCMSLTNDKMTDWRFCGACTSETEYYYIEIDKFFGSPSSTVDWLAHMHKKVGMDWQSFMDMMHRFRHATNSYNAI